MPRWAVAIPSDSSENLKLCVTSIVCAHPLIDPKDILVISRDLAPGNEGGLLRDVTFIKDENEKFSFAKRANLAIQHADGRDLILMGDDVEVVTRDAFNILSETATIRLLSPAIRGRVGPPWQKEGQEHPEVPFISFICVYLSKTVTHIVGQFEERFPGYGYEDTDYCLRARKAGLSVGVDGRVLIEHNIRIRSAFVTKYGGQLAEMEASARTAFLAKWAGM